jgi:histidine triad (HIT) family protein
MLTDEQAEDLRSQLIEQIQNFPEDKRKAAEEKILSMSNEELEEFLKQNQAMAQQQGKTEGKQCIFCLIAEGKMNSHKIAETDNEFAVLEINPIAKGHVLIIPKKHSTTNKIPRSSFSLAKKAAEKISSKLNPVDIKITTSLIMGHALIEVIPFYKDTDPSKRKKAEEKELIEIQQLLYFVKKEKPRAEKQKLEEKREVKSALPKVKPRIP